MVEAVEAKGWDAVEVRGWDAVEAKGWDVVEEEAEVKEWTEEEAGEEVVVGDDEKNDPRIPLNNTIGLYARKGGLMTPSIKIAVASGKGGTGKTTIAVNLAVVLAERYEEVVYVDCDVEEPNGHIFLNPEIKKRSDVSVLVPEVDESMCDLCGECGKACRFSAILALPQKVLTFPKLCHSCGGCSIACPQEAIREVPRVIGECEVGVSGGVKFLGGRLNIGEAMAPPVIKSVLNSADREGVLILDSPPGTSCPVIESVRGADVVLLVTEPTPFGLSDLKLAVEMVRELGLVFGVVVNRMGSGNDEVYDYCDREGIPILARIPDDREIARAYSRGDMIVKAVPGLEDIFLNLFEKLCDLAAGGRENTGEKKQKPHLMGAKMDTADSFAALPYSSSPGSPSAPILSTSSGTPDSPNAKISPALLNSSVSLDSSPSLETTVSSESVDSSGVGGSEHEQKDDFYELVVISGKGGTGKTSITASLFALAREAAVVDCDVDAADLYLVLEPNILRRYPFSGGKKASIDESLCIGCGLCSGYCRFDAIDRKEGAAQILYTVDQISCEGCGVCEDICPEKAIELLPAVNGQWFLSNTRHGPMVHARLGIAQENSGKLVSLVRKEGKDLSLFKQRKLLISDGSPGIGCPVIASIAGADMVLVVTEPTRSGLHDLNRVIELCGQFNLQTSICINKVDINPKIAKEIEKIAAEQGIPVLGRIHYDESVTAAQVNKKAVTEYGDSRAATDIRSMWKKLINLKR